MSIVITPKFRLNEERNDFEEIIKRNFAKRNFTQSGLAQSGAETSDTEDNVDVKGLVQRSATRNVKMSTDDNEYTQGIYSSAYRILKHKLEGIEFDLIYKLTEGEEPKAQFLTPEKIYDIDIKSVSQDAAYIINDANREIQNNKVIVNDGENVVREDLFKIIIESQAFKQTFGDIQFLKVKKG